MMMNQKTVAVAGVLASTGLPDVDGNLLLQLLGVAVLFFVLWNQARAAFGRKDALNVRVGPDDVTRREFEGLVRELDDLRRELPEMERRIISEIKSYGKGAYEGRQKLWDRVNDDRAELSAVRARVETLETKKQ